MKILKKRGGGGGSREKGGGGNEIHAMPHVPVFFT